jgi:hypothetical protein
MLNHLVFLAFVAIIFYYIGKKRGIKIGTCNINDNLYNNGFKNGIKKCHDEFYELLKKDDEDVMIIINEIRNRRKGE